MCFDTIILKHCIRCDHIISAVCTEPVTVFDSHWSMDTHVLSDPEYPCPVWSLDTLVLSEPWRHPCPLWALDTLVLSEPWRHPCPLWALDTHVLSEPWIPLSCLSPGHPCPVWALDTHVLSEPQTPLSCPSPGHPCPVWALDTHVLSEPWTPMSCLSRRHPCPVWSLDTLVLSEPWIPLSSLSPGYPCPVWALDTLVLSEPQTPVLVCHNSRTESIKYHNWGDTQCTSTHTKLDLLLTLVSGRVWEAGYWGRWVGGWVWVREGVGMGVREWVGMGQASHPCSVVHRPACPVASSHRSGVLGDWGVYRQWRRPDTTCRSDLRPGGQMAPAAPTHTRPPWGAPASPPPTTQGGEYRGG